MRRRSSGAENKLPPAGIGLRWRTVAADSSQRKLRAASVQMESLAGDKAANFEKVAMFTARAAEAGAELVVFPECCVSGSGC